MKAAFVFMLMFGPIFSIAEVFGPKYKVLKTSAFPYQRYRMEKPGNYIPTKKDITDLETSLKEYLKATNKKLYNKHEGYLRQYVGMVAKSKKVVFANFVCNEFFLEEQQRSSKQKNWKDIEKLVIVYDGGDCFFKFFFDLKGKKFSQFSINGTS